MKILKHEQKLVIIADLMDMSVFKIALHNGLLIIHINYPIIKIKCELYHARAISHNDGKLVLSNQVVKCANLFYEMSNFTPRKKRTKKIKHIFHEMRTIRSPFLVLTFRTFVHENRTVLVTISTDEQLGSKLRKMFCKFSEDNEGSQYLKCNRTGGFRGIANTLIMG